MAPLNLSETEAEFQDLASNQESDEKNQKAIKFQDNQIVWRNVIFFIYLHIAGLYGPYLALTKAKYATFLFAYYFYGLYTAFGVTAGAHRLFSHKSYSAKWPLRLILIIAHTAAFQDSLFVWVRDHRAHHKYLDTNADPYNAKRGLFFSHVGWLMVRKHPDVLEKGKKIDMSDLLADPIIRFQRNYYIPLMLFFCFILPTIIPMYGWNESLLCAWHMTLFRYAYVLNLSWTINSLAHALGTRPYEKSITASNISFPDLFGEASHNYHHVFPWDYNGAEFGSNRSNWTTAFIDFFAKIGVAYNRKTVSENLIVKRVLRTGDGSHQYSQTQDLKERCYNYIANYEPKEGETIWGWDDSEFLETEKSDATVLA